MDGLIRSVARLRENGARRGTALCKQDFDKKIKDLCGLDDGPFYGPPRGL
jgi:hypothetical protein